MPEPVVAERSPWWRGATIYQIYVRSWRDSNGDGTGDLAGICAGLEYLSWLGVDAIWLSPIMPSPNKDWGYDVSDYYGVHPDFGTLGDLDRLISEAAQRGIAVMLDLVPNHTSNAHAWFVDALGGRRSAHRDYYVWGDPKAGGTPPNNWLSITGGSAWSYDKASGQYFLHNYLRDQPDLNWWDERVHHEFDRILRYWFDHGVSGFRIDVAHGLYKDALLRDNPPLEPTDHPAIKRLGLRPVYNANRPEVHGVYRHWRQIADSYSPGRALLGETWEFDFHRFGDYYGREQPELHMAFNFLFVEADFKAPELAGIVEGTMAALPPGATPVWTGSNHDVGRFPSRWCGNDERAVRAALVVLATLPGTLVLYYGDELGMTDVDVPVSQQVDEISLARPGQPGRDRGRTPMPWSGEKNAGFTSASARPWLPLGEHTVANVQSETDDPASVLNFWRQLAQLRQAGLIGRPGHLERVLLDDQVWAFRVGAVTTVANLSSQEVTRSVESGQVLTVLASTAPGRTGTKAGSEIALRPWEALVATAIPPGEAPAEG
ncbi:MAG TPA: alpha-amylase family glycosyl hydrolase [Acidimicrobiales bacterium]|nr:alpha-amylase family glycosyl hydrolase [Acidimicrobiales bacterium]